jgi:hypothetical protein
MRNSLLSGPPIGVTEVGKAAMAVAIHLKFTKKIDYCYKNFEVTNWKFFGAWNMLKDTPKFQFHASFVNNQIRDGGVMPNVEATHEDDKENNSMLMSTVFIDMSNAMSPFVGKKASHEKRR